MSLPKLGEQVFCVLANGALRVGTCVGACDGLVEVRVLLSINDMEEREIIRDEAGQPIKFAPPTGLPKEGLFGELIEITSIPGAAHIVVYPEQYDSQTKTCRGGP